MPNITIMSQVGSALPDSLRADGHIACWYVLVDGMIKSGPFVSREVAIAIQAIWRLEFGTRHSQQATLAA